MAKKRALARLRTAVLPLLLGVLLTVAGVALRWVDPTPVANARLEVFDQYQRIAPRPYQPAPVRVVAIDNESLAQVGQWPWTRLTLAELTEQLYGLGAASVAFDIVFSEPDRTSPSRLVLDRLFESDQLRAIDPQGLLDYDRLFAEALALGPSVTGFVLSDLGMGAPPAVKTGLAIAGSPPERVPRFSGAVSNLDILESAATGNGAFSVIPDADGLYRRVALIQQLGGQVYPALTVEALRVAQGAGTVLLRTTDASGEVHFGDAATVGLEAIRVGALDVPTTAQGEMWVHFTEPVADRVVSADRILSAGPEDLAELQPLIAGHIVLIGATAEGLFDIRATPLNRQEPGVMIHAQALEQMILQHHLVRPDWAEGAEVIGLVVVGLGVTGLTIVTGPFWSALGGLGVLGGLTGLSWYGFDRHGLLLDPVYGAAVVVLVYIAVAVGRWTQTEQRRRSIRAAFSRYLSPDLVAQFAETGEAPRLESDTRHLTILFSDIRGFTSLSERLKAQPERLIAEINGILGPVTDAIHAERGTVDKYMGDCVMAFWNAPLDVDDHAAAACRAALAMRAEVIALNTRRRAEAEVAGETALPLDMGIGINTGEVTVGNMGSTQRLDYSVIGDAVNLASRLEGLSKYYGVAIVIGAATHDVVKGQFATLELDLVAPKGKTEGIRVYTLLGDAALAAEPAFVALRQTHDRLIAAYRSVDLEAAQAALAACRAALDPLPRLGIGGLYNLYEKRIAALRSDPPPPGWDGVYRPESK